MAVALDSNAVIGFLDRTDALHAAADRAIRAHLNDGRNLVASVITDAEVLTGARLGHHDESVVRGFFDDLVTELLPVDVATAERGSELRGQRKALALPGALILAAADLDSKVELIICADALAAKLESTLNCELELLGPAG